MDLTKWLPKQDGRAFENQTKKVSEKSPFKIQTVRISDVDCSLFFIFPLYMIPHWFTSQTPITGLVRISRLTVLARELQGALNKLHNTKKGREGICYDVMQGHKRYGIMQEREWAKNLPKLSYIINKLLPIIPGSVINQQVPVEGFFNQTILIHSKPFH
jgi:hypothetical protein